MNINSNKKSYDLMAVIRSMSGQSLPGDDTGLAWELAHEMEHRQPNHSARHGSFFLPSPSLMRDAGLIRTSTAGEETFGTPAHGVIDGIGGNGSAVVPNILLVERFINALGGATVLGKSGATVINDLEGNVYIPRAASDISASWVSVEGGTVGKQNPTFDQVPLTPHTLGAYVDITRRLSVQSNGVVTKIVLDMLSNAVNRKVEQAAFAGTGSDGQPQGILGISGVGSVSMTANAPTKSALLDFVNALETANVDTAEGCCWYATPAVKKLLAETFDITPIKDAAGTENEKVVGGVARRYLYENGRCEDFPLYASGLCPANKLVFAKASDIVLGSWGAISLMVDQYTLSTTGSIRIVCMSEWDFALLHPQSLAVGTAISAE